MSVFQMHGKDGFPLFRWLCECGAGSGPTPFVIQGNAHNAFREHVRTHAGTPALQRKTESYLEPYVGVEWERFMPRDSYDLHHWRVPTVGDIVGWSSPGQQARAVALVLSVGPGDMVDLEVLAHSHHAAVGVRCGHSLQHGVFGLIARDGRFFVDAAPSVAPAAPKMTVGVDPFTGIRSGAPVVVTQAGTVTIAGALHVLPVKAPPPAKVSVPAGFTLRVCLPAGGWIPLYFDNAGNPTATLNRKARCACRPAAGILCVAHHTHPVKGDRPEPWVPSVDDWDLLPDAWR